MFPRLFAAAAVTLLSGCGAVPRARSGELPRTVNIQLVNVVVSPVKADGSPWDGVQPLVAPFDREVFREVSVWVAPGSRWVYAWAYEQGGLGRDRPDPHGWAELAVDGAFLPGSTRRWPESADTFLSDTLTASAGPVEWKAVPLASGTRLRITVLDRDFSGDEMVGVAEVTFAMLARACEAGSAIQLPVGDQTWGQVVSVGVVVKPAR